MNVLAIGAHPDDIEIGCGGTLARYVNEGHHVISCHVANGDMGHVQIMPKELAAIRHLEAEEAGAMLGVAQTIDLDIPDLMVDSRDQNIVDKMIEVIRYSKPDIIITHSPEDYMKDHLEVGKLVFDASFSSSIPHRYTKNKYYENIVPIYYMDTIAGINFLPQEYVDITSTIEKKIKAVNCHQSQVKWLLDHDRIDFLDFTRTVSKFRGLQCGVPFAEGFKCCHVWPRLKTKRMLP